MSSSAMSSGHPYSHVTFMLSLPRSRSAWMAEYFKPYTSASWHCPLQQCSSIGELGMKIDAQPQGRVFIADVAALFFFQDIIERFPGAQFIVVHRPAREVEMSMAKLGVKPPLNITKAETQLLDIGHALKTHPYAMAGSYFELNSPGLMAAISKFVTGIDIPYTYYCRMKSRNIQVSVADQIKRTDMVKQRHLFSRAHIIH